MTRPPHQVRNDEGAQYDQDSGILPHKKEVSPHDREDTSHLFRKTIFYLNRSSPKYSGRWKSGFSTGMGDQLR